MSKREEIIKLFNDGLFSGQLNDVDFMEGPHLLEEGEAKLFKCQHQVECKVDPQKHPIWTPALGDENTAVMVVGEAPSATGGLASSARSGQTNLGKLPVRLEGLVYTLVVCSNSGKMTRNLP